MTFIDSSLLRNFAIGFALGAVGLFAISGFPEQAHALTAMLG